MIDPLGLIPSQSPQVDAAGAGRGASGAAKGPGGAGGPSFRDVLVQNLAKVNELQQEATHAVEDLQSGRRGDLEGVLLATQKADTAFRMLLAVRNKVMQAYEEIQQIRV